MNNTAQIYCLPNSPRIGLLVGVTFIHYVPVVTPVMPKIDIFR